MYEDHQFQIPVGDAQQLSNEGGAVGVAAEIEFVAHDPLGLEQARADVERRQREADFNETHGEVQQTYQEAMGAIEETASIVIDLRAKFCSDDGYINGVKAV